MGRESFSKGSITFIHGSEGTTGRMSLLIIRTEAWHLRGLRHALDSNLKSSHPAAILIENADEEITERLDPDFLSVMRDSPHDVRMDFLDEYSLKMKQGFKVIFKRDHPRTEIPPIPEKKRRADKDKSSGH